MTIPPAVRKAAAAAAATAATAVFQKGLSIALEAGEKVIQDYFEGKYGKSKSTTRKVTNPKTKRKSNKKK